MIEKVLMARYEWEEITKRFNMPDHNGTIDNLIWFINDGYKSNRLRRKYNEAYQLASDIIEMVDNEKANIPSVRRTEI